MTDDRQSPGVSWRVLRPAGGVCWSQARWCRQLSRQNRMIDNGVRDFRGASLQPVHREHHGCSPDQREPHPSGHGRGLAVTGPQSTISGGVPTISTTTRGTAPTTCTRRCRRPARTGGSRSSAHAAAQHVEGMLQVGRVRGGDLDTATVRRVRERQRARVKPLVVQPKPFR
jgi:hypothetical protein